MTEPEILRGLRAVYGSSHIRRQVLRDAELELRPLEQRDFEMVEERSIPGVLETWMIEKLAGFWESARGASWVVHKPEPAGLTWALRVYRSSRVELGGVSFKDAEHLPGQGARVLQLVASYVRDTTRRYDAPKLAGEPYIPIPCKVDRYIAWAEESGLPWTLVREQDAPATLDEQVQAMFRNRAWLSLQRHGRRHRPPPSS